MSQLFKYDTITQFEIMSWLSEQGITRNDIAAAELLGPVRVKVTNHAGQYMVLVCRGGVANVDPNAEG